MNREEQFVRNLDAARDFIHKLIDNPDELDAIEDGATVVLFPVGDPELCEVNRAMAERSLAGGAKIIEVPCSRVTSPKSETA